MDRDNRPSDTVGHIHTDPRRRPPRLGRHDRVPVQLQLSVYLPEDGRSEASSPVFCSEDLCAFVFALCRFPNVHHRHLELLLHRTIDRWEPILRLVLSLKASLTDHRPNPPLVCITGSLPFTQRSGLQPQLPTSYRCVFWDTPPLGPSDAKCSLFRTLWPDSRGILV